MEKSPLIRFVDKLDFKQIPVSVTRKKKEECPSGLILIDSIDSLRAAIKEAILGDKNVLNEITDKFFDEFIGVIHDVYHTKMTATDKKAVLFISWSSSWEFVT